MNVEEFRELQDRAERLRRQAAESEGAMGQLLARLRSEHGCKTVKEAEAKVAGLEREGEKLEAEYDKALTRFKRKWKGKL